MSADKWAPGGVVPTAGPLVPTSSRAVVVIDPEDDAALSRLWRTLPDHLVSIDQLQAALREFAKGMTSRSARPDATP